MMARAPIKCPAFYLTINQILSHGKKEDPKFIKVQSRLDFTFNNCFWCFWFCCLGILLGIQFLFARKYLCIFESSSAFGR